jgi:hypothetical protein
VFKDFKTNIYIGHFTLKQTSYFLKYIIKLYKPPLRLASYLTDNTVVEIMFLLQKRKRSLCISRVQECVSFCIQYNKHRSMLLMLTTILVYYY